MLLLFLASILVAFGFKKSSHIFALRVKLGGNRINFGFNGLAYHKWGWYARNRLRISTPGTKLEMSAVANNKKKRTKSKRSVAKNKVGSGVVAAAVSPTATRYTDLNRYPCLILNSDYRPLSHLPLSLWSWQDSLRALLAGRAIMVSSYDIRIRSVAQVYELPAIIALKSYHHHHPMSTPPMNRKGIFLRDNYCCQYCDTPFFNGGDASTHLSLDHVVPRCKGGKLTWDNTVTACMQCNFKKGARGPDELAAIGMRLRRQPYEPTAAELQGRARAHRKQYKIQHEDWGNYL